MALRLSRTVIGRKALSRAMSSESPRMVIAQNFLKMKAIAGAKDESALAAAMTTPKIDVASLPAELAGWESFLASSAVTGKYTPETTWHNKGMPAFVSEEVTQTEVLPFMIGLVVTFYILGKLPIDASGADPKNSKYMQSMEDGH